MKTKYLVSKEIESASNMWDLADGDYNFTILEVKDSRKGKALAKTTLGLAMLGNILKAMTATDRGAITNNDDTFEHDDKLLFSCSILDGNITKCGIVAATVTA